MLLSNIKKIFFLVLFVTCSLYYFLHIRTSVWVFEDNSLGSGWFSARNGFTYDLHRVVESVPNTYFVIWTFYITPWAPYVVHLINFFIHILNTFLLILLVNRWKGLGWFTGLIFLINPLSIQAVAYASGRAELVSLTVLLTFLWFCTASRALRILRWLLLIACIVLMTMTKPTLLVVSTLVLFIVFINRKCEIRWLFGLWPMILLISLVELIFLIPRVLAIAPSQIPLWRWFMIQTAASWKLMLVALTGIGISIDHAWWTISLTFQVIAVLSLPILVYFVIFAKEKYSWIALGLSWWWSALLPRLIVHDQLGWIREHHAYVPLAGFCIAISSAISLIPERYSIVEIAEEYLENGKIQRSV